MASTESHKPEDSRIFFWGLVISTLLAVFLFWTPQLDLWAANKFFHPENLNNLEANPWFEESHQPWLFFYHAAPWLTGILLLGAFGVLVGAKKWTALKSYRRSAIFVFLVIALGPGLVINSILKPYWGRPRPREVIELGGYQPYRAFHEPNFASGGKSFPCGHCSVGFSYGIGYFVFRRKKPILARSFLLFSLIFGMMMGVGRIAAGGHFLSDVVFAGLIVFWVSYWLSRKVLQQKIVRPMTAQRDPYSGHSFSSREEISSHKGSSPLEVLGLKKVFQKFNLMDDSGEALRAGPEKAMYILVGTLTLLALLLASPFHGRFDIGKDLKERNFFLIQNSSLEILDSSEEKFKIFGSARGFGLPGSKARLECSEDNLSHQCEFKKQGIFSDFESQLKLKIPFSQCEKIKIVLVKTVVLDLKDLPDCLKAQIEIVSE